MGDDYRQRVYDPLDHSNFNILKLFKICIC